MNILSKRAFKQRLLYMSKTAQQRYKQDPVNVWGPATAFGGLYLANKFMDSPSQWQQQYNSSKDARYARRAQAYADNGSHAQRYAVYDQGLQNSIGSLRDVTDRRQAMEEQAAQLRNDYNRRHADWVAGGKKGPIPVDFKANEVSRQAQQLSQQQGYLKQLSGIQTNRMNQINKARMLYNKQRQMRNLSRWKNPVGAAAFVGGTMLLDHLMNKGNKA